MCSAALELTGFKRTNVVGALNPLHRRALLSYDPVTGCPTPGPEELSRRIRVVDRLKRPAAAGREGAQQEEVLRPASVVRQYPRTMSLVRDLILGKRSSFRTPWRVTWASGHVWEVRTLWIAEGVTLWKQDGRLLRVPKTVRYVWTEQDIISRIGVLAGNGLLAPDDGSSPRS